MTNVKKPRVAIDVDFTIANIGKPLLDSYNRKGRTTYKLEEVTDWHWKSVNMTFGQWVENYTEAWADRTHEIELIIDKGILDRARKYYDVEFVTSRGNHEVGYKTTEALRRWLKHHGIDHVKLVTSDFHVSKSTLDYSFFVDDAPILAEKIKDYPEKFLLLVDTPHNKEVRDSENVLRTKDVNAALLWLIDKAELGLKHK